VVVKTCLPIGLANDRSGRLKVSATHQSTEWQITWRSSTKDASRGNRPCPIVKAREVYSTPRSLNMRSMIAMTISV